MAYSLFCLGWQFILHYTWGGGGGEKKKKKVTKVDKLKFEYRQKFQYL